MFKRLITGIILIVLVVLAIFFLRFSIFVTLTSLLILFAAWEWGVLIGFDRYLYRCIYVACVGIAIFCVWHVGMSRTWTLVLLISNVFWWLIALFLIASYPKSAVLWGEGIWMRSLMGIFVLVPCWLALNMIRAMQDGSMILMFMLVLVWSADIGAYFVGKWCGKHKLAVQVSPKKTWQGLCGGMLLVLLMAVVGCIAFNIILPHWFVVIVLAIVTALFSVIGDLLESMLKRYVNIKDTANYLPGHGGILDRIDSLTAAAPIFLLGCLLLGVVN